MLDEATPQRARLPDRVLYFYSVPLPACPALGRDRGRQAGTPPLTAGHTGHGQVGWMPRLPAAGAGRKADRVIVNAFPGSPALWAGSFTCRSKTEGGL